MYIAFPRSRFGMTPAPALRHRGVLLARLPLFALVTAFLVEACHSPTSPLEVYGTPATFSVVVNQEIDITLQTVGDGEFVVPPTLSGPAVAFLGMAALSGSNPPGGIRQVFRFKGVATGQTIILFHNTNLRQDVSDTVVVH
jgi:hypothetical protein